MRAQWRRARGRSVLFLAFACVLLGVAELRLLDLQVVRARSTDESSIYRRFRVDEDGRRGDIRDRRGGLLATSTREVDLRVWTSGVAPESAPDLAARLEKILGLDPRETAKRLATPRRSTLLATGVRDPRAIADLRELRELAPFRALSLETRYVREYPRGAVLAPLVGWVGWQPSRFAKDDPLFDVEGEWRGVAGVEAVEEALLAPQGGHRLVERDGRQREMVDPELDDVAASDGRSLELTVDPLAQELAERAIDGAIDEFAPDWAQVVVVAPATAEVLAIAQRPTPPAPRPVTATQEELALHLFLPVHRVYPPGSSFKPFMLGLVLDRGLATPDTLIDCEHGSARFGHRVIHDVHPKGVLTATQVLVESSNIGMTKLVQRLVPVDAKKGAACFEPVLDHIRSLGFGRRAIGLAGEEPGLLPPRHEMHRDFSLASLSFGQEIAVTALQMAAACTAVAHGGSYRPLRIVSAREDDAGRMVPPAIDPGQERRVFSPETASTLKGMLERVVEDGATRRWKPAGWSMAGKTGTAQDEKDHSIAISSYWCFAPVNDPKFLVLVVLHAPAHGRFAADNAGKVAGGLMGELLGRFDVLRDRPEEVAAASGASGTGAGVVASRAVGEVR